MNKTKWLYVHQMRMVIHTNLLTELREGLMIIRFFDSVTWQGTKIDETIALLNQSFTK